MMPRWHQGGMTMMLRKEESCDFDINTWIWMGSIWDEIWIDA